MKKIISVIMVCALALAMLSGCSGSSQPAADSGKVYEFVVTNHDAVTSVGQQYVETILGKIAEESGGRIKFVYYPGGSLFGGGEAIDAVKNGSADICWDATSIVTGKFVISEFINLPLNGITCAQMGSKVEQDIIDEIPEAKAELDDFYVIAAHSCSVAPLSTANVKIEAPEDFKNLSIRAAGTVQSNYINMLGAVATSMSTSDVYEALSKGVVAGMTNDWHNIDCFNLYEVVNYIMDTTVNSTSCFLLMNKDKYNALPDDLKAIFDKYSGAYASDMAGYYWDCMRFITGDKAEERGVEIYEPNDQVREFMESPEFAQEMAQWYVEYLNGYGYDGQKIYDQCMEIVSRYADEYADPYASPMALEDWDKAQ